MANYQFILVTEIWNDLRLGGCLTTAVEQVITLCTLAW